MNLLLIDLGYDCEEINEPLGIEVLSAYINSKMENYKVSIYDKNFETMEYDMLLNQTNPDIIGISTHINTWNRLFEIVSIYHVYCEQMSKKPIIIVGGILATYEYSNIITSFCDTICIVGEGEETFIKLLYQYSKEDDYRSFVNKIYNLHIENLAYIHEERVIITPRLPSKINKFEYPLPEHQYLKNTVLANGIARMEASRGCPWNCCSFCVLDWKYAGNKWMPFSVDKVVTEIIMLAHMGAKTIYFTDEEYLGGDYSRIYNIADKIIQLKKQSIINSKVEFVISTSTRALLGKYKIPQTKIKPLLLFMKEAGFRSFFLGIESGSNTQLLRFRKGSTVQEHEKAISLLRDCEIEMDIGYILFDPLMTLSELRESLEFLKRNGLHDHISRFAKRLRIVPHTQYRKYTNIQLQEYNSNMVEYSYKFNDPNIQFIYDEYSRWEKNHLHETHLIQAEIRAAVSSDDRCKKMQYLQKLRSQEYEKLWSLVVEAYNQ